MTGWFPPTVGGRILAVIGYLLVIALALLTPGFFSTQIYPCGYHPIVVGPFKSQGYIYIGLIIATLLLVRGLSRFQRWWYKLITVIGLVYFMMVAIVVIWSHALDGLCF